MPKPRMKAEELRAKVKTLEERARLIIDALNHWITPQRGCIVLCEAIAELTGSQDLKEWAEKERSLQ